MHMWVVRHCGAPSVQYRSHTNPCSEVFWIGGDSQQRLGRSLEQQAIDRCLVLICNVGDLGWQREDNVEVLRPATGPPCAPASSLAPQRPDTSGSADCDTSCRRCADDHTWCRPRRDRRGQQCDSSQRRTSPSVAVDLGVLHVHDDKLAHSCERRPRPPVWDGAS